MDSRCSDVPVASLCGAASTSHVERVVYLDLSAPPLPALRHFARPAKPDGRRRQFEAVGVRRRAARRFAEQGRRSQAEAKVTRVREGTTLIQIPTALPSRGPMPCPTWAPVLIPLHRGGGDGDVRWGCSWGCFSSDEPPKAAHRTGNKDVRSSSRPPSHHD
jgi:hypothetical protein